MAEESSQKWLGRNRPPRVHITYDLETRGAIVKTELPLVAGILADLAGSNDAALGNLRARKFVEIDRDNFTDVFKSLKPTLPIKVNGVEQSVVFESVDDFTPDRLVEKVTELNKVLKLRQYLNDLLARTDGKETLSDYLYLVSQDDARRSELKALLAPQLGDGAAAAPPKAAAETKAEPPAAEQPGEAGKEG